MMQSLNGKIAHNQNDKLAWSGKADKLNFKIQLLKSELAIMGSSTYKQLSLEARSKLKGIILTRHPDDYASEKYSGVEYSNLTPIELVAELKSRKIETVALVGGSLTNLAFFKANLVDFINISIAPIILTTGINLVAELEDIRVNLELIDFIRLDKNTLNLSYKVIKS